MQRHSLLMNIFKYIFWIQIDCIWFTKFWKELFPFNCHVRGHHHSRLLEYGDCYLIFRVYVCWRFFLLHFGVTVVPLFSSYSWGFSLGFVFVPEFFSLYRFMTFEHRFTIIAFIYYQPWNQPTHLTVVIYQYNLLK